jgi:hypothetical protein
LLGSAPAFAGPEYDSSNESQPFSASVVIKDANMSCGRDHWRELCIAAAFEENPEKLNELVAEIDGHLVERQEQLTDRIFENLARTAFPIDTQKKWIQ